MVQVPGRQHALVENVIRDSKYGLGPTTMRSKDLSNWGSDQRWAAAMAMREWSQVNRLQGRGDDRCPSLIN